MKIDSSLVEEPVSISFPCIRIKQPIGEFYCGAISAKNLTRVTWVDIRRLEEERDFETYLGIQRNLSPQRVRELRKYVKTVDACFPSAVILAVPALLAKYDSKKHLMTLSNHVSKSNPSENVLLGQIAKVLDGQHRIEGLKEYEKDDFEVNVSIFVDIDIAEQAYIFSTVNLAQTKVNKSLVYDLFELSRNRSPQKVAHNIAVVLDAHKDSPLQGRIKRLGSATPGRSNETITQATFVEALLNYMSSDPNVDRDTYKRGKTPIRADGDELKKLIFRNMMIDKQDNELTDIIWNYFSAVKEKWPIAWGTNSRGMILNKTNGFKALMRFLKFSYLYLCGSGEVPSQKDFLKVFSRINLKDDYFNVDNFKPGTSGESDLFRTFRDLSDLSKLKL